MTDAPINQPTTGTAQPIQAVDPPPDGQRGITLTFPFGPGVLMQQASYQLNQPGSLPLSQVVTLCIDNTQNRQALTVVHGAFSETTIVPAGAFQIVPTFSTRTSYGIMLSVSTAALAFNVNVIALNYARPAGSSTISANTLNNTGSANYYFCQNYLAFTGAENATIYANNSSFILSEIEITVAYMTAKAAGGTSALLDVVTYNTPDGAGGQKYYRLSHVVGGGDGGGAGHTRLFRDAADFPARSLCAALYRRPWPHGRGDLLRGLAKFQHDERHCDRIVFRSVSGKPVP